MNDPGWGRAGGNKGSGGRHGSGGSLCTAYEGGVLVGFGSCGEDAGGASGGVSRRLR